MECEYKYVNMKVDEYRIKRKKDRKEERKKDKECKQMKTEKQEIS